jgi:hypothetical protein
VTPKSVVNGKEFAMFLTKRAPIAARFLFSVLFLLLLVCLSCPSARADVGVILNESLDSSVDRITSTGHSAVYFSRICAESPVRLRLCRPDEHGSVMSNYINIGEDQSYEWNVVPLSMYLYGVEDPQNRPVFGSNKIKHVLEERYREKYLSGFCESLPCRTSYKSEWREMVAATLIRSLYIFVIDTTVEQDKELIAEFNASPNKNHFNGVTRNCADFTSRVINSYFPHATKTDYINDFGMTSPKAVARSFTRYALQHPEANFRVLHFAQVPGTIKRSRECRAGTEQLYHSKKFLVPLIIFGEHELPVVAASYMLTGRFNPEHQLEEHPTAEASAIGHEVQVAKAEKDKARARQLEMDAKLERARVVGTTEEWKEYRDAFDAIAGEAIRDEIIPDNKHLNRFFKNFDNVGTPVGDENGALWMEIPEGRRKFKVGLSASNILAPGSDSLGAYELLLARTDGILKSPKHSRETMAEFRSDWASLQRASEKSRSSVARHAIPGKTGGSVLMSESSDD